MKTLFISDLDGTLLNSNRALSDYTVETLKKVEKNNIIFSYATARSLITAKKVTQNFFPHYPAVVYNGTFIMDYSGKIYHSNFFTEKESNKILSVILAHGASPIVYSYIDGIEMSSYCYDSLPDATKSFLLTRKDDPRENPVSQDELYKGNIFYFTCIDKKEKIKPLYDYFKSSFRCLFYKDIYSGEYWFEVSPKKADKATAVLELKKILGCEKVVCFGDNTNDIEMFKISDECYAVNNATNEIKQIATGIIDSNDNDGVAKFLRNNIL